MKKSIKQLLSAVLVIAMLATLLVVPAAAADKTGAVGDKWDFTTFTDTTAYPMTGEKTYDGLKLTNVGAHGNGYANFNSNGVIEVPVAGPCIVAVQCQFGAGGTVGDQPLVRDDNGVEVAKYTYAGPDAGTVAITRTTSENVYIRYIEILDPPAPAGPGDVGYKWDFTTFTDVTTYPMTGDTTYDSLALHNVGAHNNGYANFNSGGTIAVPVKGPCQVAVQCQFGAGGTVGVDSDTVSLVRDDSGAKVATYSYKGEGEGTVTIARTKSENVYVRYIKLLEPAAGPELKVAEDEVIVTAGQKSSVDVILENADGLDVDWTYTVDDDTVVGRVAHTESGISFTAGAAGKAVISIKATADGKDYTADVTVYVQPATIGEVKDGTYDFTGANGKLNFLTGGDIKWTGAEYKDASHGAYKASAIEMKVPAGKKADITVTTCRYNNGGDITSDSGTRAVNTVDEGTGSDIAKANVYVFTGVTGTAVLNVTGTVYVHSIKVELMDENAASMSVSPTSVSVRAKENAAVTVTASGYEADVKAFAMSGDTAVATVAVADNKVTVTGVAEGETKVYVYMAKEALVDLETVKADPSVKEVAVTVSAALPEGVKVWDFKVSSAEALPAAMEGLTTDQGTSSSALRYHGTTYGIYFFPGNTIGVPVDGPSTITVYTGYTWNVGVGTAANGSQYGAQGMPSGDNGKDVEQVFTYTGGKGYAYVTALEGCTSYVAGVKVEPIKDMTPNAVDVWDFSAEELDTSLFTNKLTVDIINGWYPADVEAGKDGITIPAEGFATDEFAFNTDSKTNNRLRTDNTAITRHSSQTKLGAVGADPYVPDAIEKDATSGEVKGGEFYHGLLYSNNTGNPNVNVTLKAKAGDKITYISGSNGGAATYSFMDAEGKELGTGDYAPNGNVNCVPLTFYAPADGTYAYAVTSQEKLVVCRIYRESGVKVTVTGSVDQSLATGLTGAYSVVFTGPGGVETKAPVENGKYTIELNNYLSGADYVVSLEGADGFIVAQGEEMSLEQVDREATHDIIVASVDLVEITGKVTGLPEADLANLKLVITKPEGKIYQPKLIPAADGTFTAKFEKGVEYTVEALNVNDYALAKTKLAYTASGADDVVFSAKPTYEITMVPTPADVDLSAATITFTNKDEVDEAHPDGYVYTFTGPKGIKLRDAQYVVEVKGASGIQKLTPDLLVAGADTTCEVPFLNVTPTLWDFSDATWTSQSGAVEAYNGLVMSGVQVNKTYALGNADATIQVPVDGACTVAVSYCYKAAGTVGDVTFGTESGSTGTIETTSYKYTGEKGTVEIKYTGQSYLTKIEVIKTTPYAETVTVGADKQYKTINEALAAVKTMERTAEQRVTILIDPGDYEEMLRIDTPNVTFKNASATPSIALKNKGVDIDANAVRITSYYGHGYAYYSMESDCTYSAERLAINKANGRLSFENPGTGTTSGSYWNATVRVMASGVRAEDIIFENSFNQYVSKKAAEDVIVKLAGAKEGSVPRAEMKAGDTTVQHKEYVERAAALAIDNNCKEIFFDNCRFVGRQDTLYGGVNSTVGFYNCAVMGGTDYIFGGMIAVFAKCDLVFNTNDETEKGQKDDVGYITAPQQGSGRGYLMYNCHVTSTTPGVDTASVNISKPGLLGRPWAASTGEAVFYATDVDRTDPVYYTSDTAKGTSMIQGAAWNSGLGGESGLCGDFGTVEYFEGADTSADRVSWAAKFTKAETADGASMTDTKAWLGDWDAFAGKDMTIVNQTPKAFNAEVLKEELKEAITAANGIYTVAPDTKAEGTAVADVERGTEFVYESDKAALMDAITAAQAVVDNASATTADVLAAQKALAAAVKNFTNALKTGTKAPNTEALAKAIADAKAAKDGVMISNNTADKVNQGVTFAPKAALDALNAALKEAETTLASNNATQADVDAAKAALDQAVAAFNAAKNTGTKVPGTGVDKTELEAAVTAAEGVYAIGDDVVVKPANTKASAVEKGQKFVTQDVYDALAKAIADAKAVLADKDATEEDVTKALADLKAAQDAFKVLTGTKSSGSTTSRPSSGRGDRGPSASKLPFTDVKAEDWFYASVEKAFAKGLMKGTSETTFAPDAKTTRAMVATILYRLAGENKTDVASLFNDVAADTWYTDAVAWAAEKGIIKGYNDTTFGPENNVTREQLIVMLYRYAGVTAKSEKDLSAFTDTAAISDWAVDAMTWAVEKGILLGRGNGQLDPKGVASRAEVCTVLVRFLEMK